MMKKKQGVITLDPWAGLQKYTEARIGLGRCGSSLPLSESLKFRLAHAKARDAVHQPGQMGLLAGQIESAGYKTLLLASSVEDRAEYLVRPDKGRVLGAESKEQLKAQPTGFDISIVICDGLSAPAIHQSSVDVALGFLEVVGGTNLTVGPICLVANGRVAIGDEIGSILGAKITIMLIGERPGLSAPNSLGAYLTYASHPGTTDESRNCISNIRPGGMTITDAIKKIAYLVELGLRFRKTGVELKDTMPENYLPMASIRSIHHPS
ncbi:MAG: ethanolamine ammonia-lyase subunit EutC [Desulforhopalus sp.]